MLDRMGLSTKNNWVDENNRVYIYFTLNDAVEAMKCGKEKGVKLFAELDDEKGIGLIERKKQGMGKPTRIYVKNFFAKNDNELDVSEKVPNNREVGKSEVKTSEKPKSLLPENRSHEVGKTDPNNTNNNHTDINNTDTNEIEYSDIDNINQSIIYQPETAPKLQPTAQ